MGGPENGNFPLLYVMKMSLRRWVGGSKKIKKNTPLQNLIQTRSKPEHSYLNKTENYCLIF